MARWTDDPTYIRGLGWVAEEFDDERSIGFAPVRRIWRREHPPTVYVETPYVEPENCVACDLRPSVYGAYCRACIWDAITRRLREEE